MVRRTLRAGLTLFPAFHHGTFETHVPRLSRPLLPSLAHPCRPRGTAHVAMRDWTVVMDWRLVHGLPSSSTSSSVAPAASTAAMARGTSTHIVRRPHEVVPEPPVWLLVVAVKALQAMVKIVVVGADEAWDPQPHVAVVDDLCPRARRGEARATSASVSLSFSCGYSFISRCLRPTVLK